MSDPPRAARTPGAATRLYGVLGQPIRHSLSPALHNAAFEACGRDAIYLAFEVPAESGGAVLHGLAALGAGGASVTSPLKRIAFARCDSVTDAARAAGAANTIRFDRGALAGDNTDGAGFLRFLERAGIAVRGRRFVLLGGGGAAAGLVPPLARGGASALSVVARSPEAAALRHAAFSATEPVHIPVALLAWGSDGAREAIEGADVVVQSTPLGSEGDDPLPCPAEWLHGGAVGIDLLYHPATTPWMRGLRERGRRAANGLGLLIEQALLAQVFWFGEEPPRSALEEAVGWSDPFATGGVRPVG